MIYKVSENIEGSKKRENGVQALDPQSNLRKIAGGFARVGDAVTCPIKG